MKELNRRGSALVQALVFTMILAILSAAVMQMNLAGFLGTGSVVDAGINQAESQSVLPQVYADLNACDPAMTGACGNASNVPYALSYTVNRGDQQSSANRTLYVTRTWDAGNGRYNLKICTASPCP